MVLAHQQTGQIPLELLREILGNVSTLVSFQVSQADAARLAKEFINQYDFDIETIPAENLLRLNIGQAYCRIGKSSFSIRIPKIDLTPNHEIAERVIESSRRRFGIPRVTTDGIRGQSGRVKGGQNDLDDLDPEGVF
jgi:glutamine cyclotransferase